MNNGTKEKIHRAVSRLAAARAHLIPTSLTPSLKVASDAQFLASNQVTKSDSSPSHDELGFWALRYVKLAHGGPRREKDCINIGRKYDIGT